MALFRTTRPQLVNGLDWHEMHILSTYNAEVARGILHRAEWRERMRTLQKRFDEATSR